MIKVNLINKKRQKYAGRNWTRLTIYALFGIFTAYFAGASLYVVISLSSLGRKIKTVESESASISATMLKNNEKLSRFVLTKLILTQIQDINKSRFHYKEYLDQISSLLPMGSSLAGIDFKTKGWISLTVNTEGVYDFASLEKTFFDERVWEKNEYFSGSYVEGISRNGDGTYSTRLQLELKNNG